MLFTQLIFFGFFAAVFSVYWTLQNNGLRKVVLLAASNVFYGAWDWRFLGLIAAILSLGVLSIYSVTYAQPGGGTPMYLKQLAWIGIGCAAFVVALVVWLVWMLGPTPEELEPVS